MILEDNDDNLYSENLVSRLYQIEDQVSRFQLVGAYTARQERLLRRCVAKHWDHGRIKLP